jgi:guanylate kinase
MPARYVFISPPSFEELERRLRGRGTETEESIRKRIARAKIEMEFSKTPGVHDEIIVSDDKVFNKFQEFCMGNHGGAAPPSR